MTDNKHCYDYARPAVTVDAVVFMRDGDIVKLLLIQRKNEPFRGGWALPGGYIEMAETTEEAVHRELQEETGLIGVDLQRVDVFDAVYRDPRDRIISIAYAGCICARSCPPRQNMATMRKR